MAKFRFDVGKRFAEKGAGRDDLVREDQHGTDRLSDCRV